MVYPDFYYSWESKQHQLSTITLVKIHYSAFYSDPLAAFMSLKHFPVTLRNTERCGRKTESEDFKLLDLQSPFTAQNGSEHQRRESSGFSCPVVPFAPACVSSASGYTRMTAGFDFCCLFSGELPLPLWGCDSFPPYCSSHPVCCQGSQLPLPPCSSKTCYKNKRRYHVVGSLIPFPAACKEPHL